MNFPCQELPSNTLAAEQGIADLPCANGTEAVLSLASPATDFQLAEWRRRQNLVQAMFAAGVGEKRGASFAEVSRATGEPVANLCRYRQAWLRAEAAEPGTGWEALKPDIGTGRPSKFSLTRDEQLCLRGHNLTRGSLALAVEWFVRDARCTPATRALILAEQDRAARERTEARWPASLRRAGAVTVEERASFRGRKAMQDFTKVPNSLKRGLSTPATVSLCRSARSPLVGATRVRFCIDGSI